MVGRAPWWLCLLSAGVLVADAHFGLKQGESNPMLDVSDLLAKMQEQRASQLSVIEGKFKAIGQEQQER